MTIHRPEWAWLAVVLYVAALFLIIAWMVRTPNQKNAPRRDDDEAGDGSGFHGGADK